MNVMRKIVPTAPTCGLTKSGGGVGAGVAGLGVAGRGVAGRGVETGAFVGSAVGSALGATEALASGAVVAAGLEGVPPVATDGLGDGAGEELAAEPIRPGAATATPPISATTTAAATTNTSGLRFGGALVLRTTAVSGTRYAPFHCAASWRPIGPRTVWIHSFTSGSRNQVWMAWTSCGAGGGFAAPPFS